MPIVIENLLPSNVNDELPVPQAGDASKALFVNQTEDGYVLNTVDPSVPVSRTITSSGESLSASDNGKLVIFNVTSGNATFDVSNDLPDGFNCIFINQHATNIVDFQGTNGMVITSKLGLRLQEDNASASIFVQTSTTSTLMGGLTATP